MRRRKKDERKSQRGAREAQRGEARPKEALDFINAVNRAYCVVFNKEYTQGLLLTDRSGLTTIKRGAQLYYRRDRRCVLLTGGYLRLSRAKNTRRYACIGKSARGKLSGEFNEPCRRLYCYSLRARLYYRFVI